MKMNHNIMKKLSREKRNVDSEDPDREAAGGEIGSDLDASLVVQQPTTHGTLVEGDEESLNIQLMQRMKGMHDLEDEIKSILQIKNNARTFATGATKESVEDDRMEELEQGRKKFEKKHLPQKNANADVNEDCTYGEILILKRKVDEMERAAERQARITDEQARAADEQTRINDEQARAADEQARSIEELKEKEQVTSRMFKEKVEELSMFKETVEEELRSLVASSSASATQTGNHSQQQVVSQRMNLNMLGRSSTTLLGERMTLDQDTYSLMIISRVRSCSWILGFASFICQMTLGVMILIGQFRETEDSSIFGVPFKVNGPSVRVAQFLAIILCLSTQSDILNSVRSFLLLGVGSNWAEVIGKENRQEATCWLWIVRVGLPNIFKLCEGLVVTFASFVIIVQNKDTIDLLKDFTSLAVISEFDNILFHLALNGYLGEELLLQTTKIADENRINRDADADADADADTEMRADDNKDSQSITSQPENLQTSVPDPHPHHHVTPDDSVDIVSTRTRQPFNFIDNISISLALRLTCEINRRLAIGIDAYQHQKSMEHDASHCIFYTHPLKRSPLSSYIDHLFQAFDKKQRHFENVNAVDQAAISSMNLHIRAIALIYLERACSEKTVRQIGIELVQEEQLQGYESNGHGGCGDTAAASPDVTCPHLNPTNVHKLFLAALILASRTYFNELPVPTGIPMMNMRDQITADYARMIQASGDNSVRDLAAVDLANLLEWMAASLGAEGFVVHMEETNSFIDNWRHIFG